MALKSEFFADIPYLKSYQADISSSSDATSTLHPSEYPGILDTQLTALTSKQRIAFTITVLILSVLSLCGNFGTIHVNSRRKMRPFFRACLISLALSDVLSTVFLSMAYLGQFSKKYVQVWSLGVVMCSFDPFATTAAILASSMTLVGITLFRYFAVMKVVVGSWNPGVLFSVICMLVIWTISIAIASPVFLIYHAKSVYLLTEENGSSVDFGKENSDDDFSYIIVKQQGLVTMCVSGQKDVALYYIIVFSIIFVPCIVSFVWLNSIIASRIWKRRHAAGSHSSKSSKPLPTLNLEMKNIKGTTIADKTEGDVRSTKSPITSVKVNSSEAREARHIRMFIVVTLLVAVFIFFRLPAWIFLVMRLYGNYSKPQDWIIYFVFGILNLTSCVLNPLFYTFLPETMRYFSRVKMRYCSSGCCKRKCKKRYFHQEEDCFIDNVCFVCDCVLCGTFWICRSGATDLQKQNLESGSKSLPPISFEKDEGVVCSDESENDDDDDDDDGKDLEPNYGDHIFTVYSATLVSSSTITSENG